VRGWLGFHLRDQRRNHRDRGKMKDKRRLKGAATIVGVILLLAGAGVALAHYLLESSLTSKFITLAIAGALFVAGFALLDWGADVSRRWGLDEWKVKKGPKDPSKGNWK
jgi:hypothetical protein